MGDQGRLTLRLGPLEAQLTAAAVDTGLSAYAIAQLILEERLAGGVSGMKRAALVLLLAGWAASLRTQHPSSDVGTVGETLSLRLEPHNLTVLDRTRGPQARSPWAAAVISSGL